MGEQTELNDSTGQHQVTNKKSFLNKALALCFPKKFGPGAKNKANGAIMNGKVAPRNEVSLYDQRMNVHLSDFCR